MLANRVKVREADEDLAAKARAVVVGDRHKLDILGQCLGDSAEARDLRLEAVACRKGQSGREIELILQLSTGLVGALDRVEDKPVPATHRETGANTPTVTLCAVLAHLTGGRVDIIASTHSLVERLLHAAAIVLEDAAVHHELELAVLERRATLRHIGEHCKLRACLFVLEREHRVDRVVVPRNGF